MTRRLASLDRIPRGSVLRLHRYHHGAPTSRRPSRPAPFRSLGRYHVLLLVARQRGVAVAGSSSVLTPVPQSSAFDSLSWRRGDLPGSSATPVRTCPALRPRRTGCAKATNDAPDVAFRAVDGVGSAFSHLSRLNHTACSLAVYASQLGLLRIGHHARLASHWRPTLLGQDSHLLGCFRRFPLCASTHIVSPSSWLSWRTNRRDAVTLATQQPARPAGRSRAVTASQQVRRCALC